MSGSGNKMYEEPPPPYKRSDTSSTESSLSTTTSQGSGRRINKFVISAKSETKEKVHRSVFHDSLLSQNYGRRTQDSITPIQSANLSAGKSSSDKPSPTKQSGDRPFVKLELEDIEHLSLADKMDMIISKSFKNKYPNAYRNPPC